jgi:pimeloyl-ACP methyl ester carboxylesterase
VPVRSRPSPRVSTGRPGRASADADTNFSARLHPGRYGRAILLAAAPASAWTTGPAGLRFYTPPKTLAGQHGDLIWARAITGRGKLSAASRTYRVLYRSTSAAGKPIAVSGDVSLPKGRAPKGGWPVVSWAHGTSGAADVCAPSRTPGLSGPADEFDGWLKAGYAVARTDYEGLGTPGPHPYLIGVSAGRTVIDIVTSAGQLDRRVGRRWAVVGASQGGHAALFAAALAAKWAPKLTLRGVDALAPASHIKEEIELSRALTQPSPLSVIGSLLVSGLIAADPSTFTPQAMLTPAAQALLPDVERRCLADLGKSDSWGGLAPASILRTDYDRTALYAAIGANDPMRLRLRVPVLVQQGLADLLVFPSFTDAVVKALRTNGARVDYRTYAGADHPGVVGAGEADTAAWLKQRLG